MNRFFSFWPQPARFKAWFGGAAARSRAGVALICGLSCALVAPQILHFASRDDIDRQVWNALPLWNVLERQEYALLDQRFAKRGIIKPKSLDSIAIVGIDGPSVDVFKEWPWPRSVHASLVDRLSRAGARVIVLDIGFNDYFRPRINPQTGERELSDDDQKLAQAIERAKNVVLVSHLDPQNIAVKEAKQGSVLPDMSRMATPIDEFDVLTPDLAVNYVKRDSDGGSRRYPLRIVKPPETAPLGGIAPLAVAMFQGLIKGDQLEPYQSVLQSGRWPNAQKISHSLPLKQGVLPGGSDAAGRTRVWTTPLYYWGPQGTFPTYSYSDVAKRWSEAKLKKHFQGRLVMVGATYQVLKDVFPAPDFGSGGRAELPGVEVHATMAAMMLDGTYLRTQSTAGMLWTLLGLTLAASIWTSFLCRWASVVARRAQAWWASRKLPSRVHSPIMNGLCAMLGPLPIAVFWWGSSWAFSNLNFWVITIYPIVGAALASVATLLLLFGAESAERRKITTQMSRLVAPDVMDEILAHPEEDYPRSRRVHATVLFTDLEGFTSFSESREPEEVVTALNEYFKRMQPIVHAHGGSVDKYIGDSVMAFFGAPVPRADHAAQALRCAIALQDECARFRQETGVPFWMRVGVHTGDLIVGSVGSDEQNNYTAIGDTVNLASRLEASNKSFGSRIICSATTYAEAPDVAQVEKSRTPIRGKRGDVEILIVRGPLHEAPRDTKWGHGDLQINWDALHETDWQIEEERRLNVDRRGHPDRRGRSDRRNRTNRASANDCRNTSGAEEQNTLDRRFEK